MVDKIYESCAKYHAAICLCQQTETFRKIYGGSMNFVHGGISLQEMVVPVI